MMSEPLWRDGPWHLLSDLRQLVADRVPVERQIQVNSTERRRTTEKGYRQACEQMESRFEQETATAVAEGSAVESKIGAQYEADLAAVQRNDEASQREIRARAHAEEIVARDKLQEGRWHAGTMFEAAKGSLTTRMNEIQLQLEEQWKEFDAIQQEAQRILRRRWLFGPYPEPPAPKWRTFEDPLQFFTDCLAPARQRLASLSQQSLPSQLEGWHPLALFVVVWAVLLGAAWYWLNFFPVWLRIASSGGGAVVVSILWASILFRTAKRESNRAYLMLRQVLIDADHARRLAGEAVKQNYERKLAVLIDQRHQEQKKAEDDFQATSTSLQQRRDADLKVATDKRATRVAELTDLRDRQIAEAADQHSHRMADIAARHQAETERLQRKYQRKVAEIEERYRQQWETMAQRWTSGLEQFQTGVEQLQRSSRQMILDWHSPDWRSWVPASQIPSAIPFGQVEVKLNQIEGAIPQDERLRPPQTDFSLPAIFPSRDRSLLLLKAAGDGLVHAVTSIQTVMLRMLTSMPPGKVRFTIIDPVGLGENFSAFMHMADYNDQLVSNRIWTDSSHIEQRLAELTGHMENVIQVYLRNEFNSIDEYNKFAGDLAEPYRILVVANFPAAFSDQAASRLASIVASGARCGVYTVMSVDTRVRVPRDFHFADIERYALRMNWTDGRFLWEDSDCGPLPLSVDKPPEAEVFTEIVRCVGRAAKDADRVEVPFSCVAPADDQWWTQSSAEGIDVPLGRAGAMKLQSLRLGRGTSQHVIIAGKTGSGKSTLLHALVTNVAMRYSPDEVQVYLIDFKKGVEFKAYAQCELPHARVIAIESEREFGLSVLERLDLELKQRGDLFRSIGVHDLPGFRAARPDTVLPRILLIVDEFQELFVEDDRIAQNASLLLDRLVRQGRAFGVHVLLGSQTLAGSYSLPRSTIGQMAVRIALQCSDADAHLILSEDNTAARLLGRPGEAIYNDANGLFEGNHPFQVVWLDEDEREQALERVKEFAHGRNYSVRAPIVFEGNMSAELAKNPLLGDLLSAPTWPAPAPVVRAWLGSAVAIKDPTSIDMARQSGKNLLVVGHQEKEALGVLTACFISLASQHAPGNSQFYIFDGARAESPAAGLWSRMATLVPHNVQVANLRAMPGLVNEISEELARREQSHEEAWPSIYLLIYDLARFRDLRRADDDFSFSRRDEDQPPSPAIQFSKILREGPSLGIHVLMWCDTYANVGRALDRPAMREIELRILFQMNVSDSSNLIDSPAASQLGVHRALLYNEGDGRLEKFRPYGPPSDEWLAWFQSRLGGRE